MNYCNLIVKVIKDPVQIYFENNISVVEILVKFSPVKKNKGIEVFNLLVWGNLAEDVIKYYKINDYIIVEGFISLQNLTKSTLVQISVRKIYPLILNPFSTKLPETF